MTRELDPANTEKMPTRDLGRRSPHHWNRATALPA
jgi:hypothetical protein